MEELTCAVVVEEGVEACAIHQEGVRVDDSKPPCGRTVTLGFPHAGFLEVRVVKMSHGREGSCGGRVWLVVSV